MLELDMEDVLHLLNELEIMDSFEYIILDMDFGLDKKYMKVFERTQAIVLVCDGDEMSNTKTLRAYQALTIMEEGKENIISNRMSLIYNKFSNKTGRTLDEIGLKNIGGAPRYDHASAAQIIEQLAGMNMFEHIL